MVLQVIVDPPVGVQVTYVQDIWIPDRDKL